MKILKAVPLLCCILVFALLLPVLPRSTYASDTIFLTAINDNMLSLQSSTMPAWIDGQIYVPYTTFDSATTGLSLGTHSTRNRNEGTVTVYSLANTLMFDMNEGYCIDNRTKLIYPYKAIMRNNVPYLPVAGVCNFFDLSYTYQNTQHGQLLRLTSNSAVLSDSRFVDAANSLIASMLETYLQSKEEPTPLPEPPVPTVEEEEEVEEIPTTYYCLGVELIDPEVALPNLLYESDLIVTYFFTVEQLEMYGDLLRELLGRGHFIGLKVEGNSNTQILEQINQGNALMAQQGKSSLTVIHSSSQWQTLLEEEGYLLWKGGDSQVLNPVSTVVNRLTTGAGTQYLTLEQTETTVSHWATFLSLMTEKGFVSLIPMEHLL